MTEAFGLESTQWQAIEATAVCASAFVVAVTALFAFRQLRLGVRSGQFEAVRELQSLIDGFREERAQLFRTLPAAILLTGEQFPDRPPPRHRRLELSDGERRRMLLTEAQRHALTGLSAEQRELVRRVVIRFNDIGQLVEDGFIPKHVFYGKYHLVVLRCAHLVEAVRREIEDADEGGNFGQRLVRMRFSAARYNDIIPKHRDVPVFARVEGQSCLVYESGRPSWAGRVALYWARVRAAY